VTGNAPAASGAVAAPGPAQLVERVQELQTRLESAAQSPARDVADELVAAIVQMYGAGLERIMAALFAAGAQGEEIAGSLAADGRAGGDTAADP
jgi:hypothetical protein